MKMTKLILPLAIASAFSADAALIFNDTYNYTTGAPGDQTALGTDLAARQCLGSTTSSYTEQLAGSGTRDALLTNINSQSQLRFRTTNTASSPSQTAVDLNTNFASSLAGKQYSISLMDLAFVRGAAATLPTDIWFAISVGDTNTSISGPADATADASVLIQAGGNMTKWEDNSNANGSQNAGLSLNYGFATRYAIAELRIDETGAIKTAQAYFKDMSGNEFTSDSWVIDFDNSTNRFIELRAHQGSGGTDGTDVRETLI